MTAELKPGSRVCLGGRPEQRGVVVHVTGGHANVFWANGREELVALADLVAADAVAPAATTPLELVLELTARRLQHPLTDQLLSYRASRTRMMPHQFIPVRKLIASPAQRILVADEVGTGKTIEAGLIWAELEARAAGGLSSVLVVCPNSLVTKWQDEFLHRFDLRLEHLDPQGLRQALTAAKRDGVMSPRFSNVVVGLQLLRTPGYLEDLIDADVQWDLVIIDEAHHLRNPDTRSHAIGLTLGRGAAAMALLTATPAQTSLEDLRSLYQIMGVEIAADAESFAEEMRLDMMLNDVAVAARKCIPGWHQGVEEILRQVSKSRPSLATGIDELRRLLVPERLDAAQQVEVRRAVHDLQAFSPYFTRTMRADIDEKRPVRTAMTRKIEFTAAQRALYDAIYATALRRAEESGAPPGFVTQMPERRTASCAPAVARAIAKGIWKNDVADGDEDDAADWNRFTTPEFVSLARAVLDEADPKMDALLTAIREMWTVGHAQLIVFSTFRDTLSYLAEQLASAGYSVEQMHGDTPARDEDCRAGERSRDAIAAAFRAGEFQILVASEVASEGLDFQHCAVLVNYDLPWNPMRVEQRIGRIDRIGQQAEKITIISLSTPGTIESRILDRLYLRLGIFERALGEMELVLGDEMDSFERDLFSKQLTPAQQEARLDRVARVVEERRRNENEVEAQHGELLAAVQRVEVQRAEFQQLERRFLGPSDLQRFVVATLRMLYGDGSVRTKANEEVAFDLEPMVAHLGTLSQDLSPTSTARRAVRAVYDRARRGETRIVGTFSDTEYRKGVEFIHIRHPLVLLCRRHRKPAPQPLLAHAHLRGGALEPGWYVAGWAIVSCRGIVSSVTLEELVLDERGAPAGRGGSDSSVLEELADAQSFAEATPEHVLGLVERLPGLLAESGQALMEARRTRNDAARDRARASLERATSGRRAWLSEQLGRTNLEPKLRRMFQAWEQRLDHELAERLRDLDARGAFQVSTEYLGAAVLQVTGA